MRESLVPKESEITRSLHPSTQERHGHCWLQVDGGQETTCHPQAQDGARDECNSSNVYSSVVQDEMFDDEHFFTKDAAGKIDKPVDVTDCVKNDVE